jgi:serine/threonine protein kinase
MWSLGCIVYELITGKPLFPAHDENELLEFMVLTVSRVPEKMLENAKKCKQFYVKKNDFFSFYQYELIRSKESTNGEKIIESSQPVAKFLENRAPPVIINFIE